jgi:1-aminocyclopropane-1-carboxylate deaminase
MLSYQPLIDQFSYKGFTVSVLRLDLLHPHISGNKWFKLTYNLKQAKQEHKDSILSFGGAFSNHIAATAFACKEAGFKSIGIIRGEATSAGNPTLSFARENGMELHFVSREEYKLKHESRYLKKLEQQLPTCYIIPEGGDNDLGQKGCEEILNERTDLYHSVFCAYGTGTTFKGIARSLKPHQTLTGINVLNYEALSDLPRSVILNRYHFGGYAKHTTELLDFKTHFEKQFHIPLDYVYTAKLFFAVFDLMDQGKLNADENILIIHSGGLQGNEGYKARYNL